MNKIIICIALMAGPWCYMLNGTDVIATSAGAGNSMAGFPEPSGGLSPQPGFDASAHAAFLQSQDKLNHSLSWLGGKMKKVLVLECQPLGELASFCSGEMAKLDDFERLRQDALQHISLFNGPLVQNFIYKSQEAYDALRAINGAFLFFLIRECCENPSLAEFLRPINQAMVVWMLDNRDTFELVKTATVDQLKGSLLSVYGNQVWWNSRSNFNAFLARALEDAHIKFPPGESTSEEPKWVRLLYAVDHAFKRIHPIGAFLDTGQRDDVVGTASFQGAECGFFVQQLEDYQRHYQMVFAPAAAYKKIVLSGAEAKAAMQKSAVAGDHLLLSDRQELERLKNDTEKTKLEQVQAEGRMARLKYTSYLRLLGLGLAGGAVAAAGLIALILALKNHYMKRPMIIAPGDTSIGRPKGMQAPFSIHELVLDTELKQWVLDKFMALRDAIKLGLPLSNMLFYGAPGTGKTMAFTAFAYLLYQEGLADFAIIRGSAFKRMGSPAAAQRELAEFFKWIGMNKRPVLVFCDEVEGWLCDRSSPLATEMTRDLTTTFLSLNPGGHSKKVMFAFSTNRVDELDDAVLDRIDDSNKIEFKLPGLAERQALIHLYLNKHLVNNEMTVAEEVYGANEYLAGLLKGYSGRQIDSLIMQSVYGLVKRKTKELDVAGLMETIAASQKGRTHEKVYRPKAMAPVAVVAPVAPVAPVAAVAA